MDIVLNLIITGIPSIPPEAAEDINTESVLNLIITGIPSILGSDENSTKIYIKF